MFFGSTGAGKSTIVNALIHGSDKIKFDEELSRYVTPEVLTYAGREMFKIGDSAASCTREPGFYPMKLSEDGSPSTYFVDCPGIGDANAFLELPN